MKYYGMTPLSDRPIRYLNVQKLYSVKVGDSSQFALETAIDREHIVKDVPFHRAYSDAYYTTKILRLIPSEIEKKHAAYDLYHLPVSQEDELHLTENGRNITISHMYGSPTELLQDPHLTTLRCEACAGRSLKQGIKWYGNGHIYHAAGICPEHGHIASKIRIKRAEQRGVYAERCVYPINENEYNKMQIDRKNKQDRQRRLARSG